MKRIKLIPINEPDMMVPNALEIIRGGVITGCTKDECVENCGGCDRQNSCYRNEKECDINICNGNYVCHCNGQACYQDMGAIYP